MWVLYVLRVFLNGYPVHDSIIYLYVSNVYICEITLRYGVAIENPQKTQNPQLEEMELSYPALGRPFGRHHTTILYGVAKVSGMVLDHRDIIVKIAAIRRKLV